MEAAYEALLNAQGNLADIAARLGFSAPSHFVRFFRDHLGATPSEFRKAVVRHPSRQVSETTSLQQNSLWADARAR
jgi:AraC-like DNA-binding protein